MKSADNPEVAERESIYGTTLEGLREWLKGVGQPAYRGEQVLEWVYRHGVVEFERMANLPLALRAGLSERFGVRPLEAVRVQGAGDTTRKYLFRLGDGMLIESVLIPASPALYGEGSERLTLCISTQVGCAYGCRFCASGLDGWSRNLSAGEIVAQVVEAGRLSGERVGNLVFMGMGEPLANFGNLKTALEILNAPWGLGIGARKMTISTSGLAPRIRELAELPLQVRLAVSLHGATDAVREQIMPVNRKYPVEVLLSACEHFAKIRKQRITFEYILIRGVNDREEDARELVKAARRVDAKVNCIPYNTVEGLPWERPEESRQELFMSVLRRSGVTATLRREKGHDIAAACGQLRRQTMGNTSEGA